MPTTKLLHWDVTSQDYLKHRPGYPERFFAVLKQLGIGLPGQDILDLGTGTGALSVPFACQGASVTGADLSEGQILAAREAASRAGVRIAFKVAPAEKTKLPAHSFDVVSASMCWGYFDLSKMLVEVPRLLRPNGRLLISSLIWTKKKSGIAAATDKLIAKHNPAAAGAARAADAEVVPAWAKGYFELKSYHDFTTDLLFTRESWRGRIRACKWIGAALPPERTLAFDREHEALLDRIAPPEFPIEHRIRLQAFAPLKAKR
jgi:2-polyprenyl-3-methyl-5-hydroxy-6-metoxy-1,4-benzoquinol methylase